VSGTSPLAELQAALQGFVLDPRQPVPQLIVADARIPPATQAGVYAEAYRARLVGALDADFSGLHAWLGDDEFTRLVHAYLAAHPSRHYSLRGFGGQLAAFLAVQPDYAPHRELADMACFEWAQCHAFDAPDATVLEATALAGIPPGHWPGLRLHFHPALVRLDLHTNAPQLWLALHEGQAPPAVECYQVFHPWLVWRHDLRILFRALPDAEGFALDRFRGGATFGAVCDWLCGWFAEDEVPARAAGYLREWVDAGLVVGAR
jgi:hypothetical protein